MDAEMAAAGGGGAPGGAADAGWCCAAAVRTDFDRGDQCYVLHLAHSPGAGLVAAALSNRRLKLYAPAPAGLAFVGDLGGGAAAAAVAEAHFAAPGAPAVLHACGADGAVRGWDARAGAQVEEFRAPGGKPPPLVSCALGGGGALVAAGGGDAVFFWDRRAGGRLAGSYADTHAGDVTQVRFAPAAAAAGGDALLVSASEDGLLAVHDTRASLVEEDDGFVGALNLNDAVARLGFCGAAGGRLWATTGTEGLALWDWAAACAEDAEGGGGPLLEAPDARARLGAAAAAAGAAPLAGGVDFLVACEEEAEAEGAAPGGLAVLAGTSAGALGAFPVEQRAGGGFGPPAAVLAGGHADVVRCAVRLAPGARLTGGEDSLVCLWTRGGGAPAGSGGGGSDGAVRWHAHGGARRASPY